MINMKPQGDFERLLAYINAQGIVLTGKERKDKSIDLSYSDRQVLQSFAYLYGELFNKPLYDDWRFRLKGAHSRKLMHDYNTIKIHAREKGKKL